MLWLNSSRERIKSENPGISVTEISKKAGEMWRQLGKDEKEVRLADQCRCLKSSFALLYLFFSDFKLFNDSLERLREPREISFFLATRQHFTGVKAVVFFILLLLFLLQEWETKAGEAKEEYEKAKKEYKESGRMPTSTSKK